LHGNAPGKTLRRLRSINRAGASSVPSDFQRLALTAISQTLCGEGWLFTTAAAVPPAPVRNRAGRLPSAYPH